MTYKLDGKAKRDTRDIQIIVLLYLFIAAIIGGTIMTYLWWQAVGDTQRTVKEVCNYTRTTDAKEEACGIAQDTANMEYLCQQRNARDDNV